MALSFNDLAPAELPEEALEFVTGGRPVITQPTLTFRDGCIPNPL
ncbi:hypothetical protein [Nonomuraea sp. NPDC050310]